MRIKQISGTQAGHLTKYVSTNPPRPRRSIILIMLYLLHIHSQLIIHAEN